METSAYFSRNRSEFIYWYHMIHSTLTSFLLLPTDSYMIKYTEKSSLSIQKFSRDQGPRPAQVFFHYISRYKNRDCCLSLRYFIDLSLVIDMRYGDIIYQSLKLIKMHRIMLLASHSVNISFRLRIL